MLVRAALTLAVAAALLTSCAEPVAMPPGGEPSAEPVSSAPCLLDGAVSLPGMPWQERPGMYEPSMLPAAMDTQSARLVVLQPRASVADAPVTWTFDVCRNSWQRTTATMAPDADVWQLVYHAAADLTLGIPRWKGPVRAYSTEDDAWTDLPTVGRQPGGLSDSVYDPDTRTVIGWSDQSASLWSYDVGRRTWSVFAHRPGEPWPDLTSRTINDWTGYTLLAYDTVRDAVLLAVFTVDGRRGTTWSFDVGSGRWTDLRATPPALLFGYAELGGEMAYDSANGRAVAITGGDVAVFDSRTGTWSRPSPQGWGDIIAFDTTWAPWDLEGQPLAPYGLPSGLIARTGHTLAYDPTNGRVLMVGGTARLVDSGPPAQAQVTSWLTGDVWAYDVGDNAWTQVVPEQDPLRLAGTYQPTGHGPAR